MIKQIKPGDRLKSLWYKNVRMSPLKAVLKPIYIYLICSIPFVSHHISLTILDLAVVVGCLSLNLLVHQTRLNDYLIMVRYPLSPCFYLYQSVRKRSVLRADAASARTVYLAQMRKVLEQLPPGRYRTVTQPMFTRVILRSPQIKVVRREKAYRKRTQKLVQEVYSTHVRKMSETYKQFYFVEFEKEGVI